MIRAGTVIRVVLMALALACSATLVFSGMHFSEYFRAPDAIFWGFAAPLLGVLLCTGFLVLPTAGRLALGSLLVTVALVEGIFAVVSAWGEPEVETYVAPEYYEDHEALGWVPKAGITTPASKRVNGAEIYDVEYAIDDRQRRITPVSAGQARSRFLLFFGGSCTFGEGLEQAETLPSLVAKRAPSHMPYNYGFHGYGPQQLLARLESESIADDVEEDDGILVYLFIDSHVNRAIGSLVIYTGWAHAAPYYEIDASGQPARRGNLTTGRPVTSLFYSLVGRSQVLRYFNVEMPLVITDSHVEHTAQIFARSAALFREQFRSRRFVVVMFPGSSLAGRLGAALDRQGVESLDYSQLLDYSQAKYHLPEDWHPTAEANEVIAEQLAADLAIHEDVSLWASEPQN